MRWILRTIVCILIQINFVFAQTDYYIQTPLESNWNVFKEGKSNAFKLRIANNFDDRNFEFSITQGKQLGMLFDSTGSFSWEPNYILVDRIEQKKLFQIYVEARSDSGDYVSKPIDLLVEHVNQAPVVNELKPFYVQYNTINKYQIDNSMAFDNDGDPLVFIPSVEELPEGLTLSSRGEITWSPSFTQFRSLKEKPVFLNFYVEDQPSKSRTNGRVKLVATQLDLPPSVAVIPNISRIKLRENETINLGFYLSDPNGDDDIDTFDYLSNNNNIRKQYLVGNTPTQYEFIWSPGYDFVTDPNDSINFYIDFYVLDKTQKRDVKRINFTVLNTINEKETDESNYSLYKGTMLRAWELMEQLKEKEEALKKSYNRAKKGKKERSVVNASLGATTGLSSIFTKDKQDLQRMISTIGGTTVLTIGTLEATEVIGKSMKDLIDRLNYVIEKKNEIQTKGDVFARDFSLKSSRRSPEFKKKMDEFMATMSLKGLVALELNATWEPKNAASDQSIRKTFKDYNKENN